MQGREYIHVRRKVNGMQKQKFFNIDRLSPAEIALVKFKANRLDKEWESLTSISFMDLFLKDGDFKYIKLLEPNKKNGWHLKLIRHVSKTETITISRSLEVNDFESAFNAVFRALIETFNFSPRSTNVLLIKRIWLRTLKSEYRLARKAYTSIRKPEAAL